MIEGKEWDDLNESIRLISFQYCFQDPSPWERKAARLKYAADRLFDSYEESIERYLQRFTAEAEADCGPVVVWHAVPKKELDKEVADISLLTEYCLLMGYSIENLLKGLLTLIHPEYFSSEKIAHCVKNHDLVNLSNLCALDLSPEEADLLLMLTNHILWIGKYPIPLKQTEMYPRKVEAGIWESPLNKYNGDKTKSKVENFYIRLSADIAQYRTEDDFNKNLHIG